MEDLLSILFGSQGLVNQRALPPHLGAPARPHFAPAAPPTSVSAMPPPAPTVLQLIPQDALTFVENEEDGSQAYYAKYYTHWSWPAGASGPTIAVGYDCGYVTKEEAQADWTGIVDDATVQHIISAVGLKGDAAAAYVRAHRGDLTITWAEAIQEFSTREVPKWVSRIEEALPNYSRLPGECRGAIFSLAYNRGTGGFRDPSARDREMNEIYSRMASANFAVTPEYLGPIAGYIAAMARIWPNSTDLRTRRAHEAALFRKGLEGLA
jgi:hypothetical protein